MTSLGWYLKRLTRMGPAEVVGRARAAWRIHQWRTRLDRLPEPMLLLEPRFSSPGAGVAVGVPAAARDRLLATAEQIMAGRSEFFGLVRDDLVAPGWSHDPKTGRHAPTDTYSFDISYRDEQVVGDIKQLWELSRHHHLTILAAAFAVTGDDRYAWRISDHLKSWWTANPPMRGVHWISGIELGIRLLSWVWVRRLLDTWSGASDLFENNPEAQRQIYHHQRQLAALPSIGSSANNHAIAEAAGQLAAACAFPWFVESHGWIQQAGRSLDLHLRENTFTSGLNRELATEYHGLVLELGLAAALEAASSGHLVPDTTWRVLTRMCDALAAVVDTAGQPPRQGDADDGHGLVVDGVGTDRWASLLCTGETLFGRQPWWPKVRTDDVRTALLTSLGRPRPVPMDRPRQRPSHFADAGMTILRAPAGPSGAELWCRCDGGPHGFLSIGAHAHADALSVEVRHDGVEVLADPGTFCYHGEPQWRSYFRSTLGHNTLELENRDQSSSGGPFMWTRHARSRVLVADTPPDGVQRWVGEHSGYSRHSRDTTHRRTVDLDGGNRRLTIVDEVRSGHRHPCRLAFHLGPRVTAELSADTARLRWQAGRGRAATAVLQLPTELSWSAHRGESAPPLGWYSAGFGRRQPSTTLVGSGLTAGGIGRFVSILRFES